MPLIDLHSQHSAFECQNVTHCVKHGLHQLENAAT